MTNEWDTGTDDAVTPRQAAIGLLIVVVVWVFAAVCCGLSL